MGGMLCACLCRFVLILACASFAYGLVMIDLRYPFFAIIALLVLVWDRRRKRIGSTWSHGSAAFATLPQTEQGGLLEHDGLILGRCEPHALSRWEALRSLFNPYLRHETAARMFLAGVFGAQWVASQMLRVRAYVHLASFAPAGAGKGVAVLVPNLLSFRGSCVVTDPKGELFKLTAQHRQKRFGHKIIRLDPFGVCGPGSDTLNPFDFLDHEADDFLDQCRDLANMLVVKNEQAKDPHWDNSAELNLTAFSAFVCGFEPDRAQRNLQTVRQIASSRESYALSIDVMRQVESCQGVISRLGGLLTWFTGEELGSVMTTFQRHTAFLDSPAVTRNIVASSFDPRILRTGKATVYLILPAERLVSLAPLQRMWIGTIMRVITRGQPTEKNPVLWLLDEMAHIGKMRAIEDAVTLMRGMGMRLWFFFQSLEQLKTCFGEHAPIILDNIGTQQYFGINSYATADELSKRIGESTIAIRTSNDGSSTSHNFGGKESGSGSISTNRGFNYSDTARRLIKPEELLLRGEDTALIFHRNLPVVSARLIRYYNAPEFRGRGCGTQGRLGLSVGVMACFTFMISLLFAGFAEHLPPMPPPSVRTYHGTAHRWIPAERMRAYGGAGLTAPRPAVRTLQRRRASNPYFVPNLNGY